MSRSFGQALLWGGASARVLLGLGYAMPHMNSAVAAPQAIPSRVARPDWKVVTPPLLLLGLIWWEVVHHLGPAWSLDPQYAYGWSVPFLALFLLWKRWPTRPDPQSPPYVVPLLIGLIICAVAIGPIRFVAEANPDWRFLSWAFAVDAVVASLFLVCLSGGPAWLRYFAFPFLFFLVAVPWPTLYEQFVIQSLMRAVTAINVTLINLAGVPAVQHGNVVEVGSGLIGIEEACSGVRSLQATLMISLFLGDLYSFRVGRRFLLVLAGGLLAFICNVARTAILVWIGAHQGTDAIEKWHDPAGLSILLFCLFGLWALSLLLQRRDTRASKVGSDNPSRLWPVLSRQLQFVRPILLTAAIVITMAEVGVQWWYARHQTSIGTSRWAVQWPQAEADYKPVPITHEAEGLLHYNEGGGAAWQSSNGHPWMMYFFRWLPGRTAARFVKIHRPDICLPASGMTLLQDDGMRLLQVQGVSLPVRSYRFDDHGRALHVFYCYWDARSSYENATTAEEEDWSARGRLRAALRGRRELGAQMLELVVWGYDDDAEADAALKAELDRLIRPG